MKVQPCSTTCRIRDGMRGPVSGRDALSSQLETHSRVQTGDRLMKKNSTGMQNRKQVKQAVTAPWKTGSKRKQQLTIGLDLGDKTSRYCALDEDGEVLFERSVATTKKGLTQVFGALGRCRVALEVGTHSPWVSGLLKSLGHELIVANARQVKLITQSSRKNDKLDAQSLARLARVDPQLLRPIQHRSEEAQQHLMMIRVRAGSRKRRASACPTATPTCWKWSAWKGCRLACDKS